VSGIHDLTRFAELAGHFRIPCGAVVNKYDLNEENARSIEETCAAGQIAVFGRIPFSPSVSRSIVAGIPPVLFCKDGTEKAIHAVWEGIIAASNGTVMR
ncbi:MAG TPA: (4Fe-4S)-binding protein, partial [bacterium]|nr:(4Fe-4S)-binding protein [bacterium]